MRPSQEPQSDNRARAVVASPRPVHVALVNDDEIILHGLQSMLAPYGDRVVVVDYAVGDVPDTRAHVALFDTYGGPADAIERIREMVEQRSVDHVVLYTWKPSAHVIRQASLAGVSAVLLKSAGGRELVEQLERIVRGERIGFDADAPINATDSDPITPLSEREQQVLSLLSLGRSNPEIADELFLSVDTVKTYVRRLFSKLGVNNRTSAALLASQYCCDSTVNSRPHVSAGAHGN